MPASHRRRGRVAIAGCAVVWWLGCGALRPLDGIPEGQRRSSKCVDPWSWAHAAGSAALAQELGSDSFLPTMLVTSVFEELEPVINPWWDESLENQRCDYVFNALGWLIQSLAE